MLFWSKVSLIPYRDMLFWSKVSLILDTTYPSLCTVWAASSTTVLDGSSIYQMMSGGGTPYSAVHSASTSALFEVVRSTSRDIPGLLNRSGSVIETMLSLATNRSISAHMVVDCPSGLLSFTWHFQTPVSLA